MQLKLSESELTLLAVRIQADYQMAIGDHNKRMERFRRYYRKWRGLTDPPIVGDQNKSNFNVPMLQWHVLGKLAKLMEGMLGDDAEIVAKPIGKSDVKAVKKASAWICWRVFQSMKLTKPLAVFFVNMLVYGRSFAYAPWRRDTYMVNGKEEVWYEGPGFEPLKMDDIIVPAEDAVTVHDFSWTIRKYWATPQQLLQGEHDGRYFGIKDNFEAILNLSRSKQSRNSQGDELKREEDSAEGVQREHAQSARSAILIHEWCGRWRLPKGKDGDGGSENDLTKRHMEESELLVSYAPDLVKCIGVQDLAELYPMQRDRRPLVEISLIPDGSYWSMGMGELLDSIQDETSANYNLFQEAGQFSVGPIIFYKPGSGFKPTQFRYEPNTMIPTDQPGEVNVVKLNVDMAYPLANNQNLVGLAESVTGETASSNGRSQIQPNAPRTATGQMALLEAGNVRVSMDLRMIREDAKAIILHIWMLDSQFAPESQFFRVTEEDANGLFDVKGGVSEMTSEEFGGRYDFELQFATSVWAREAQAQKQIQLYGMDLQNPLIVQNQRALWLVTNAVHEALGDKNFAEIVPAPPDLGLPKQPKEEWTMMLQGEEVQVNPADNDEMHIADHVRRIEAQREEEKPDRSAINEMISHVAQHQASRRQKMLMQALTQQLVQQATDAANQVMSPMEQMMLQQADGGGQPQQPMGGQQQPQPGPMEVPNG